MRGTVALRKESVDRNWNRRCLQIAVYKSLSARRAWIEIFCHISGACGPRPSLSARRAWIEIRALLSSRMAALVALRKESVDRNRGLSWWTTPTLQSLSARRAWIEIQRRRDHHARPIVALRKESVDRNILSKSAIVDLLTSLSARRAWIEIFAVISLIYQQAKSLSARRAWIEIFDGTHHGAAASRRSPQGERG